MTENGNLAAVLRVLDLTPEPSRSGPSLSRSGESGPSESRAAESRAAEEESHAGRAESRPAETVFSGTSIPTPFGDRIYGGQVLAQALLACGRTVAADRPPHSLHAYFLREGKKALPIEFVVENLRDGGSFSARRVRAVQQGNTILSATASFQLDQPGYVAQHPMPDGVPAPEEGVSTHDVVKGYDVPTLQWWGRDSAFDIVPVGQSVLLAPDPSSSNRQMVWVRARGTVPPPPDAGVSEQLWHRALLAYACDQLLLEPAVRGAGKSWMQVALAGVQMASLDHAMWWHRDFRVDQWLLFVQEAGISHGGRTLGQARVYTRDGALVASIAQEGLMRLR